MNSVFRKAHFWWLSALNLWRSRKSKEWEKKLNINNYTQGSKFFLQFVKSTQRKSTRTSTLRTKKVHSEACVIQQLLNALTSKSCSSTQWLVHAAHLNTFAVWSIERSLTVIKRKLKFMLLFDAHLCLGYVNMPKHFQCFGFSLLSLSRSAMLLLLLLLHCFV